MNVYQEETAEGSTSSNSLKNNSPPEGSVVQAEGARISPSNILPLPKTKTAIKWGRSAKRSDIITCSALKNSLLNVTKKRRLQDPTRPKEEVYDGPTVARPTLSEGKKKKGKENIFSHACAE